MGVSYPTDSVARTWVMAVWQLIFTIIFVKIVTTSCKQYGSLTFVIDDTQSMQEEINKVKDAATRIFSHINQRSSQIKNVVLVTFNDNDPGEGFGITSVERARLRLTSSSKSVNEFSDALSEIDPAGGGYCPEYCLTGTELALRNSLQNSYVFVFTDASPKDVVKKAKVIKDAQAKGSQIYFFLTTPSGKCVIEFKSPWKFQAYYDIAAATNGQVFKLETKKEIDEVLHLLDILISGEGNVIGVNETPANQYTIFPFTVDDQTEYIVVSAAGKGSGSDVQLSLITGPTRTTERVAWLKGVKVLKINNPLPGSYAVSVHGTSSTTVMIIGRTDFTFEHGFSETVPPTFRNDKKQPTDGLNYHLLVKVTDPNHSTDINKAVIVSKDGRVINLPLKKMEGDYYTTGLFMPPNSVFTIKIVGVGKRTGKEITRMAKTPIEPRPRDSDPVITTSGGGTYNYNSKVMLTCKVKAHPKPEILWKDEKGNLISTARTTTLSVYNYNSELIINNVKKSAAYYCYAENSEGENSARIDVSAESPFTVHDKPNEAVNVEYGSPTVLECNIRSHLEIKTFWYINNEKEWKPIQNSNQYSIINNGKQLKINKVEENEEGKYKCVATIAGDSEMNEELPRIVKINHVAPVMGKAEETRVKEGESTSIKCNILKAYPKPEIIWQFKKSESVDFQNLKISNVILDIKNANSQSTGTYKCTAKNYQGSYAQETKLTVLTKPTLTLSTNNKEISSTEIDYNGKVSLVCRIMSNSVTKIVWKNSKNEELRSDKTESLKQHEYTSYLTIPQMRRSERYTCAAHNEVGENSRLVSVAVKSPFEEKKDRAVEAVTVEYGKPAVLDCNIRSHSQIKRVWYQLNGKKYIFFKRIENSKEYSIINNGIQLKINKIEENEEGKYICVAYIPDDSETKQESQTVVKINHVAPIMGKAEETHVRDGESTSIKCNILNAYPKPEISWQFKKSDGTDFQDLKINNVILDIKNANPQSTGTYKCIAKNDQGSNAQETKLILLKKPTVTLSTNNKEISSTEIDYNGKVSLVCRIVSNSVTKIVWKNSKNEELRSDKTESLKQHEYTSYLTIPQMRRSERYTCAAHNEVGENSRLVSVAVKSPFEENKDRAVEAVTVEYGKPAVLDCNIRSHSQIKRVWYHLNGKKNIFFKRIENSKEYSIINNGIQLKINKIEENEEGKYICVAYIPDDSETKQESQTVVKINHVAPIMGKAEETHVRDGESTSIKCNVLKAYPKPEVSWQLKKSDDTDFQDLKINNVILDIKNANPQSTGTYKCIAKNDQGSNAKETKLIVLTKPTVNLITNNKEIPSTDIDYNGKVSLVCRVVSNSATKIVWKNSKNQELRADMAESLKQHEYIRYLTVPQMRRSESYKCTVTNNMGENSKVVSITVRSPFQGDNKNTFLDVKYGEEAKLTCNIKSQYPMNITWYNYKGVLLHTGPELMIKEMNLNLQGKYTCKASLIEDEPIQETRDTIVKIVGLKKPQIEKRTSSMDVQRHQTATLKCKILQGHPKPEVTWEAKTEKLKKYMSLNVSGEEIFIKLAEYNDTGLYKCTATNVIGKDEFTIQLTVTGLPAILSDEDKLYSAVEGDVDLRIPCEVIGYPKPTIQWKKGNNPITVGGQFEIEDEVLVINNPKEQNTNYTCLAANDFGSVQKTFTAFVTKTLPDEDLSDATYIYMLEKETRDFECQSGSGKGRWFIEWNPTKLTGTMTLRNVAIRDSGNYTCRVSDRLGSKSFTYVVDVGFPPTFRPEVSAEDETIKNWRGRDQDLYCGVYMQPGSGPTAKAEWLFNGKPSSLMSGSLLDSIHPIIGWGNYTCIISNHHDSVRKNFYVHSKGCLLHLDTKIGNSPLILDSTGKWPELSATSNKYLYVKPEQSLLFSCHNQAERQNAFKTLPSKSELVATCNHEDNFQADGKIYQYSNLQCSSSVEPLVQTTGEACGSKNTEVIKVGYNLQHALNKFLEVYSVCFDKSNKVPVYSTVSVSSPLNAVAVDKPKWQIRTYDDKDRNYCDEEIGCCVVKYQLVNQMDVRHGPAQISTFNENLNSVFVWNNCKYSNVTWNEVEIAVNEFYDEATVWTGAVGYSRVHTNGSMFPQYLWKIARNNLTTETIVVVKVNNPSPRPEDILCATQCNINIPNDKYTYCCSLQEFQQKFEVPKNFY